MACDFTYVDPVGEITSSIYDSASGAFGKVIVSGTSLPSLAEIEGMYFADSPCVIDEATASDTNLECALTQEAACGTWNVAILTNMGFIPIASQLGNTTITCTVSSISPSTNLNVNGGKNLTISGSGFPHKIGDNIILITFSDG